VLAQKLMEMTLDLTAASGRAVAMDHAEGVITILLHQSVVCGYEGDQRLLDGTATV
jgi:hypothetical protein